MRSRPLKAITALAAAAALLVGCTSSAGPDSSAPGGEPVTLRVGAVSSPMTDVVEAAAQAIDPAYEIELVEVSDYVTINNMLAAGDLDANFSQHVPYMELFNEKNGASLRGMTPVYNFVIAFYSKTLDDIADLPQDAVVAIPNDAANAGRALKLLADNDILTLDPDVDPYEATTADITENPKNLQFLEVEIAQLNTAYDEADLVFQWPSMIAALGLNPQDDGLLTELDDRFALNLVVRSEDADTPATDALITAFTSDEVLAVIEANPTIEPAF
ncbi:MetQ/NlpA family ABC transporter substrate-binding protein [Microbacterium sp.]|uniref:MetQ/NlpA family ABC transporter substrate-binding protein n=1 Tax=Microbacterium sp. TaxID=51671 RepID=UPI003C74AC86